LFKWIIVEKCLLWKRFCGRALPSGVSSVFLDAIQRMIVCLLDLEEVVGTTCVGVELFGISLL